MRRQEGRFDSVAMDEDHLTAAARCVALNPMRARLVERAWDWPIPASARIWPAATTGFVQPLIDRAPRFADLLDTDANDPAFAALRRSELIGRPLGDAEFPEAIGRRLNHAGSRGRKPRTDGRRSEAKG